MNRRNFVGNLLAAGAAFWILPSAKLSGRIWVPDRTLIVPAVASIWDHYFITEYGPTDAPSIFQGKFGSVMQYEGSLWYKSTTQWWNLEKKLRIPKGKDPYPALKSNLRKALERHLIVGSIENRLTPAPKTKGEIISLREAYDNFALSRIANGYR